MADISIFQWFPRQPSCVLSYLSLSEKEDDSSVKERASSLASFFIQSSFNTQHSDSWRTGYSSTFEKNSRKERIRDTNLSDAYTEKEKKCGDWPDRINYEKFKKISWVYLLCRKYLYPIFESWFCFVSEPFSRMGRRRELLFFSSSTFA